MTQKNQVQVARPEVEETRERPVYAPRADIYESADAFHLVADLPGVDGKSVEATIERNVLTISASFEPVRPEGHRLVYSEFGGGEYRRSFQLTDGVDAAQIAAEMKNGVLHVTVPKSTPARTRITVAAG